MKLDLTTCGDLRHHLKAWAQATPLKFTVNGKRITSAELVSVGHDGIVLRVGKAKKLTAPSRRLIGRLKYARKNKKSGPVLPWRC